MVKKNHNPAKMHLEDRRIDKWLLLKILQQEELLPADATSIIGTGHTPDALIVTVGFD